MATWKRMKVVTLFAITFLLTLSFVSAQTVTPVPARASSETLQLQALTRKIEEQNAKIDILSQQILKLEQQLVHTRPGVMIGETERAPAASAPTATPMPHLPGVNTHTVARGETLTSIAKLYGITIGELQRFNHIDDPLKLRAGQTLMIPPSPTPDASAGE
ncbi:MAG: LysM domain-containing protein [Verrucomicrobiota bacterium]